MIVCVDVDYRPDAVVSAGVGVHTWTDSAPCFERVVRVPEAAAPYRPGEFFLRELPPIVALLETIADPELVVIDGYVWLATNRPGLGARLYERLGARVPVIGVAKRPFRGNDAAIPVTRGGSARPLYVTALGLDAHAAAANIAQMHGAHRIPTILKHADRLSRDG